MADSVFCGIYYDSSSHFRCQPGQEEMHALYLLIADYQQETQSKKALFILENWEESKDDFQRYVPLNQIKELVAEKV